MSRRFQTPEICPVCGATVRAGARACADCGADERTGWDDEKTRYDGLDLPDESFDDDETRRDAGLKPSHLPRETSRFWWLVAIVLVVAVAGLLVATSKF
jgi:hypothetical protein